MTRSTNKAVNLASVMGPSDSHPDLPHLYPRRILLAVTGLSPQVVTETLYALAVQRQPAFVPDEVHVITTGEGASYARHTLLEGGMGRFTELLADYGLAGRVRFDADCIHTITDEAGRALTDIQSPSDNGHAADTITELVRRFTRDAAAALHVSIAGGRKTMGFFMGYALSLYGRPQDRLSHVLVSAPFEANRDFYYPPSRPCVLYDRDNKPVHTADARVMLAEIPFVRMRHGLPDDLVAGKASFSAAVNAAQSRLGPPRLALDPASRQVRCGDRRVEMEPAPFALYYWLATRARQGLEPVRYDQEGMIEAFLSAYAVALGNPDSQRLDNARKTLERRANAPASRRPTSIRSYFDPLKAKANTAIEQALGERAALPYLIQASGNRLNMRFGLLMLDAANIDLLSGQERS